MRGFAPVYYILYMNILYSDKSIAVCEKSVGVASQETPDGNNMLTLLKNEGLGECYPVHRLDTATGGIMVYARTQKAAADLSKQIQERKLNKKYYALIYGTPAEEKGDYNDLLYHDRQKNKSFVVKKKRAGVKEASLSYECVSHHIIGGREATLVDVALHTGRTHQIRVQFSFHGNSLVGDGKYGAKDNLPLMLFCHALSFRHPVTGEQLSFNLPCPFELTDAMSTD